MSNQLVLGIDGGGTKTEAVVMDMDGAELGRAYAGSTNWNSVGVETALTHLTQAVDGALARSGVTRAAIVSVCIGAGGVDRPPDRARMTAWLAALFPSARLTIHNDAVIALAAGTGGEVYGVVLISGTGMIVYGFDRDGNRRRAGGWGALLGDPGSGYALGTAVLKAVTWAVDGRAPQTMLTDRLLSHLGMQQPQQLVAWAYENIAWERFAALAPLAIECAEAGDAVAQSILDKGAEGLAIAVNAVLEGLQLQSEPIPLILAGGMLRPGPYQDAVRRRIHVFAPLAQILCPTVAPVIGAAWLARQVSGD
jgi:N-acetylglucosamine kinase-like BadF-type ATPase